VSDSFYRNFFLVMIGFNIAVAGMKISDAIDRLTLTIESCHE
jgi:hypothetical protein